uniref:Uncharacterized protein n=1 Tax=Anguilla anguilla TaxID=7936 RepID=A0A0E9PIX0_ANGAN
MNEDLFYFIIIFFKLVRLVKPTQVQIKTLKCFVLTSSFPIIVHFL